MNKHTPGPWVALERYTDRNAIPIAVSIGNGAYAIFCECNGLGGISEQTEGDCNARLIAAAPELLEALSGLLLDVQGVVDHNRKPGNKRTATESLLRGMECHVASARAAIAKARGL